MMLFTMKELTRWLGITVIEVWIWLLSVMATLLLVILKIEKVLNTSNWWLILAPLFTADALNTYFCVIVFIRMYHYGVLKPAALRALWSFSLLTLGFIFKILLCKKLVDPQTLDYSVAMSPLFILLQLIIIRACHLN